MNQVKERQEFENYSKLQLLGEGSYGKAYLVQRNSDGLQCVMKQIDIGRMSDKEKREVLQESRLLEALQHPNIVKFIEVYKTKKGKLCIIMDYADGGDLSQKIKERRGQYFGEDQVLDWFTQICLGMKHIHDRKIIHRDLKGQNVFLTKKGIIQIGDFGIAKVLAATVAKARTCVGTPYYLSPEVVQSQPYSLSTDVWSMGVMLYEMCALKPPFDAKSLPMLSMAIIRGKYAEIPPQYSYQLKMLIKQCLSVEPSRRPTVNQILKMPLVQNRIKTYLSTSAIQTEFSHTILHKQNVFDPPRQPPASAAQQNLPPPQQRQYFDQPRSQADQVRPARPNYHFAQQNKESAANPEVKAAANQQLPLSYADAAQLAQVKIQNPGAVEAQVAQAYRNQLERDAQRQKEIEAQQARDEADRKRAEQLNKIMQDRQEEQRRLLKAKQEKDRLAQEKRKKEIEQLQQFRLKQAQQEEENQRQQLEIRAQKAQQKKEEEERYFKQLEEARKQAYQDRVLAAQRAAERLSSNPGSKLQLLQQENQERRQRLEEQSRQRQEEALRLRGLKEEQRREEDMRRKHMYDEQRKKWLAEKEKKQQEEQQRKEAEKLKRQAEVEKAKEMKEKRLKLKEQEQEQRHLEEFQQQRSPSEDQVGVNTIQKITKDVCANIQNIVDQIGEPKPELSDKQKLRLQREEERKQMRNDIKQKAAVNKRNRPQWQIVGVPETPQTQDSEELPSFMNTPIKPDPLNKIQPLVVNAFTQNDQQLQDRPDISSDSEDDFTRSNAVHEPTEEQAPLEQADDDETLISQEMQLQAQRWSADDPTFKMYQEMLQLVRDYSDEPQQSTEPTPQIDLEPNAVEFSDMSDREDSSDSETDSQIVDEEISRQEFTFQNEQLDEASKMLSTESVREYLEAEIGDEKLVLVYPILLDIGDDVFQDADLLYEKLGHLLTKDEIRKYQDVFTTLIFFEKQAEQSDEDLANVTLKNLSAMLQK